jgi:hypothetical protein
MDKAELVKLNTQRLKYQLSDFTSQLKPELIKRYKRMKIFDAFSNEVTLDDIDFNKSCIFISDIDILPYVTIYALQKINKVLFPDESSSGNHSRIRTNYLYVESPEIRYSKLDLSSVQMEIVPEMYKPSNFLTKELCIWRWVQDVGSGKDENMYRFCNERVWERYYRNQVDWIFFIGTVEEFNATYNSQFPFPVYCVDQNVKGGSLF